MAQFGLEIACWHCDGEVELINSGPVINRREHTTIVKCKSCRSEFSIRIDLVPLRQAPRLEVAS